MVKQVNVHEAKTHLSRLLEEVAQGEEIIIGKAGKPVARLVPYQPPRQPRKPGALKGQIWMADDWDSDEVNKEIEDLFYHSDIEPST
jgi:prevent-host-death family protein